MRHRIPVFALCISLLLSCTEPYDVVVVGGGTGGTAAAIEAARGGARTLILEQTPWLGGMLTSAGVSAIDGNYRLRGGLFGEFTDSLSARYRGYEALRSGWVSNILFNPAVGADILKNMAGEAGVEVRFRTAPAEIVQAESGGWVLRLPGGSAIRAKVLIDGTELGDIAEKAGAEPLRDTMTVAAARNPYDFDLYTRAVAVGDYPVDHHHVQNPRREELSHLWFGKIPSFSVPLGVVIPVRVEDLLVADKAVSTSWEMNGGTRLQPVVMGLGQAAGALAAVAVLTGRHPSEVPVSEVQSVLLDHGCYLLPFLDLKPGDPGFRELQEKGVRGEVRGTGRSVGWANETWVNLPENE